MAYRVMDSGGTLQTVTKFRLLEGTNLRTIRTVKIMDTDGVTLRLVANFVPPLTASATDAIEMVFSDRPENVSATSTATPIGGASPFTYVWSILSGTFTLTNGTSATATFSTAVGINQTRSGTAKVVVTDSVGTSAEATIAITLSNFS